MAKETKSVVGRIKADLDWLKDRVEEIKRGADSIAYDEIEDRKIILNGAHGPAEKVVATKEVIEKSRREALKDYAQLLELINNIEATEDAKVQARGGQKISPRASRFMAD